MMTDKETYERIGLAIHSDDSPVGIDAKKTHIMILAKLEEMQLQLEELKEQVRTLNAKA